jgi:hypothetical protein
MPCPQVQMGSLPVGNPALDFTYGYPKLFGQYAQDAGRNVRTRVAVD